jgi:DNA-binding NarL/FixJ family response regulator
LQLTEIIKQPAMNPIQSDPRLIKIIIADDHALVRIGFITLLQNQPRFRVVADTGDGAQLLNLIEIHKPDIVLMDIRMPVMDGVEATQIITQKYPGTAVITLTAISQEYIIADMLSAGAKGFLLKDSHPSELVKAINAVANNQNYYCPSTTVKLNRIISNHEYDPVTNERNFPLTPRETQVLKLICKQNTNKEISQILKISVRTVECYRSSLHIKTKSLTVAGIVNFAIKFGIHTP